MRSGEIGPGKAGGLRRLALTDADKEMRDLFITWCTEAGCTVHVDRVGQHLRAPARRRRPPAARADGQPPRHPGRGRQVRRHRRRARRPRGAAHARRAAGARPSARSSSCAGPTRKARASRRPWSPRARSPASSTSTGCWRSATTTARCSAASSSASATTARPRWAAGASTPTSSCTSSRGPILDREAVPVGIVVGGYATRGMHVDVHGETAHAGPTPMDRRRNALVGAAMLAVAVNDIGWKYHATEGKATVARMVAWPNKAGILSEYAQLTCDVRHAEREVADQMLGGGEGGHARLRAPRQRRDAHRRASGSSATSASTPAASASSARPPQPLGVAAPGHPEPGRPRRLLHLAHRPHRDDLHALPRRHLPQRGRARRARLHRRPASNVLLHVGAGSREPLILARRPVTLRAGRVASGAPAWLACRRSSLRGRLARPPCMLPMRHGRRGGSALDPLCAEHLGWTCAPPWLSWCTSSGDARRERQYRGDGHHDGSR